MSVHIFGIRHHGPGSARSVREALESLKPDCVLVEGPPDVPDDVLRLIVAKGMKPPVALLVYPTDSPQSAVFYPFAEFSPEWQALSYALKKKVATRFMDLPQGNQAAIYKAEREAFEAKVKAAAEAEEKAAGNGDSPAAPEADASANDAAELEVELEFDDEAEHMHDGNESGEAAHLLHLLRDDPIGVLAQAAGYSDRESWWEHQIEQRLDSTNLFTGVLEAMGALREQHDAELRAAANAATADEKKAGGNGNNEANLTQQSLRDRIEDLREAHMRQTIRAAKKEGFKKIAVVCGAWHSPKLTDHLLDDKAATAADAELLKGLPNMETAATWIPWTHSRLSYSSGYGAGVTSPGWYSHLWEAPDRAAIRWVTQAARLLRDEDLDASSASVIEAVRLAETLAALRDLPMPGLTELNEAILTVLCHARPEPMELVRQKLEIGELLGKVPKDAPAVPLQRNLEREQARLKLTNAHFEKTRKTKEYAEKIVKKYYPHDDEFVLALDLRDATDIERSRLLYRLQLLGIPWGKTVSAGSSVQSTKNEIWKLKWDPEFVVALVEGSIFGNTVADAAANKTAKQAEEAEQLSQLTELVDAALLADLPRAIEFVLTHLQAKAAVAADVTQLMDALPPLAKAARYVDVRGTKSDRILPVFDGMFERVVVGLPAACNSLDDTAAAQMVASIGAVHGSVNLLDVAEQKDEWARVMRRILESDAVHGLVRGWVCRLLMESQLVAEDELYRLARLALSPAQPPASAASWLEGLLRGSGQLLLHLDRLWFTLDEWLRDLLPDTFTELLPMLRRAFAGFEAPERQKMGDKVKHIDSSAPGGMKKPAAASAATEIDTERADRVLPVIAHILGVPYP